MTTSQPLNEVLERLGHASGDVRAARARLREEQEAAWRRYVATVESVLADDLALPTPAPGGAGEDAEGAVPDPVHVLLEAVHGRIDDLRVQAQLGRMEAADLLEELQLAVGWIADHVKPA